MEHIHEFDDKFRNLCNQFQSSLNYLLECEKNSAEPSLVELNLYKIFKILSELEVLLNSVEMKFIQQRIRVGEFLKRGGIPRIELEILCNYQRFSEAINIKVDHSIGSQIEKLNKFELDGKIQFHFMPSRC